MDPLANLQDIHLPEAVHSWPLAPGWWIILALLITAAVIVIKKIINKRRLIKNQKLALKQLQANEHLTAEQSIAILKWTCIQYFKREDVAAIHGDDLLNYLSSKLDGDKQIEFKKLAENSIRQQYRRSANTLYAQELQQAAILWVNNANLFTTESVTDSNSEAKPERQESSTESSDNISEPANNKKSNTSVTTTANSANKEVTTDV